MKNHLPFNHHHENLDKIEEGSDSSWSSDPNNGDEIGENNEKLSKKNKKDSKLSSRILLMEENMAKDKLQMKKLLIGNMKKEEQ